MLTFLAYEELKDRNLVSSRLFGPYYANGQKTELVSYRDSLEEFFNEIDGYRSKELYKHSSCTGVI